MKLFKIITFLTILIFVTGCTPKITVKSLHPSKIPNEKFHNIHVEEFINDSIYQASKIEEKIANKIIDNKKVFKLTDGNNSDVLLAGKVLQSSLDYNIFYKRHTDYSRCRYYRYDEKSKKRSCIEYYVRVTPCEDRTYKVKTKIDLIDSNNESILFSKIYEKQKNTQKCYDYHYYPYHTFPKNKKETNSKLAEQIAADVLDDISPHYVYYDLKIIEKLDDSKIEYTQEQKEKFTKLAKLIEEKKVQTANEKLKELNFELKSKSWEILYNLALTYEAQKNLFDANRIYKKAKLKVSKIDDLELINNAINRTLRNLKEKIKAKSQLPNSF